MVRKNKPGLKQFIAAGFLVSVLGAAGFFAQLPWGPQEGGGSVEDGKASEVACVQSEKLRIGAYYYTWYNDAKWRAPITNKPQRGLYQSADPTIVAQHVHDARQAGIDFFILSWTPQRSEEVTSVLDQLDQHHFPYMVLYESGMALGLKDAGPIYFDQVLESGERIGERFAQQMEFFQEHIGSREGYYRIEDKPALMLYVVRDYYHANDDIKQAFAKLRSEQRGLYVIADVVYWPPPRSVASRTDLSLFDAVTGYNMYAGHLPVEMKNYLTHVREHYSAFKEYVEPLGGVLIPNFQPGYDDRLLRGTHRPVVDRENGRFFRASFELASQFTRGKNPHIFLTSFNEWFEGTEIEPSQEYAAAYLGQLCELKREFISRDSTFSTKVIRLAKQLFERS